MYDLIVVGAGPAGITAAIYAARKKLAVLVLTNDIGGQAAYSGGVENYTGFQFIQGPELAQKFGEHVKNFENIDLHEFEPAECIRKSGHIFEVNTSKGEYKGNAVILAPGRKPRKLDVPGEDEFKNKGVTYCATCDGPLFSGKDVAIVGGGNSALDAALQMMKIAGRVYMINIAEKLTGDEVMIDKVNASENVEVYNSSKVLEIKGNRFVESLAFQTADEKKEIQVSGVLVEIGSDPVNAPACDLLETNDAGEIIVNERCETNIPGLFSAGDVTDVPFKQIIIAAGQGCIAALSASLYLLRLGGGQE